MGGMGVWAGVATVAVSVAVAGCGGADDGGRRSDADGLQVVEHAGSGSAGTPPPESRAPVVVRMTRVQGDDPLPFSIDLHADRTAKVQFGGGHGGFEDKHIRLTAAEQRRIRHAVRTAPWKRLDGHTVTPGGFGGDDNGNRYSLFHGRYTTTLAQGHIPARMARLVHLLDRVIDGDMGHMTYAARHSPLPITPTPPG
jgi:hypothetical protein